MNETEIRKLIKAEVAATLWQRRKKFLTLCAIAAVIVPLTIWAAAITKPFTFSPGQQVSAAEINANFDALVSNQSPIVQVVSTTKRDVFSTTSTTPVDVTGLSVTITPKSSTSKFLIFVNLHCGVSANNSGFLKIMRDGVDIASGDPAGVNRVAGTGGNCLSSTDPNLMESVGMHYLDSPNTASTLTYHIQACAPQGAVTLRVNTGGSDNDVAYTQRSVSTITVFEVLF